MLESLLPFSFIVRKHCSVFKPKRGTAPFSYNNGASFRTSNIYLKIVGVCIFKYSAVSTLDH